MPDPVDGRSFLEMVEDVRSLLTVDLTYHSALAADHSAACRCFDCACAEALRERQESFAKFRQTADYQVSSLRSIDGTYCRECGGAMFITSQGVTHHGSPRYVDSDQDADHVAVAEYRLPTREETLRCVNGAIERVAKEAEDNAITELSSADLRQASAYINEAMRCITNAIVRPDQNTLRWARRKLEDAISILNGGVS